MRAFSEMTARTVARQLTGASSLVLGMGFARLWVEMHLVNVNQDGLVTHALTGLAYLKVLSSLAKSTSVNVRPDTRVARVRPSNKKARGTPQSR